MYLNCSTGFSVTQGRFNEWWAAVTVCGHSWRAVCKTCRSCYIVFSLRQSNSGNRVHPKSCRHLRRNTPFTHSLQSFVFIFFMALYDKNRSFYHSVSHKPRLQKNIKIQVGCLWCHFYYHIRRGLFGVTGISISYGKKEKQKKAWLNWLKDECIR